MHTPRRHRRISDTKDLVAKLHPSGPSPHGGQVLNLSEGGMLIAGGPLKLGQKADFEITGPSMHYAGVAEVAHLSSEGTGLRFLSWEGHDNRPIRSLIEQRSEWQAPDAGSTQAPTTIRRVAVLTGRKRPAKRDAQTP
jgi:hypothetical protein